MHETERTVPARSSFAGEPGVGIIQASSCVRCRCDRGTGRSPNHKLSSLRCVTHTPLLFPFFEIAVGRNPVNLRVAVGEAIDLGLLSAIVPRLLFADGND